ncbi:hypothetical protein HDR63_01765 [bacterium]|nr:hypothetical protein [bacterium]
MRNLTKDELLDELIDAKIMHIRRWLWVAILGGAAAYCGKVLEDLSASLDGWAYIRGGQAKVQKWTPTTPLSRDAIGYHAAQRAQKAR